MSAFDKVIGYAEIKREMLQVCDMIKNRDIYEKMGAKMPRGMLLYGEPGLGKTLLCRCFVVESGLPSFVIRRDKADGAFIKSITECFRKAKAQAPAVVLLDDLDKFANEDREHKNAPEYVAVQAGIDTVKDSSVYVLATANVYYILPDSLRRSARIGRRRDKIARRYDKIARRYDRVARRYDKIARRYDSIARRLFIANEAENTPLMNRFVKKAANPLVKSGEVVPTNLVPVLATMRKGGLGAFPMRWGFNVEGRKVPLINARSESTAEKPAFQEAWAKHRCIIPVSWYYEWAQVPSEDGRTSNSVKYAIQPANSTIAWLCGFYRIEDGLPCFILLTREAGPDFSFIHDRMPLILEERAAFSWIKPTETPEIFLPLALTKMVAEKAE